jgi:hypothetical protein
MLPLLALYLVVRGYRQKTPFNGYPPHHEALMLRHCKSVSKEIDKHYLRSAGYLASFDKLNLNAEQYLREE